MQVNLAQEWDHSSPHENTELPPFTFLLLFMHTALVFSLYSFALRENLPAHTILSAHSLPIEQEYLDLPPRVRSIFNFRSHFILTFPTTETAFPSQQPHSTFPLSAHSQPKPIHPSPRSSPLANDVFSEGYFCPYPPPHRHRSLSRQRLQRSWRTGVPGVQQPYDGAESPSDLPRQHPRR